MQSIMLEKSILLHHKHIKKSVARVIDAYWTEHMYCRMYLFKENVIISADDDKGLVVTVMVSETNLDCFYESFIASI